jgi:hypothetical protein
VHPPRNRKGETGNPPPTAGASEFYPDPIGNREKQIDRSYGVLRQFSTLLEKAEASGIEGMRRFVRQLKKDMEAVENAVKEVWSNGPVEGHIVRPAKAGVFSGRQTHRGKVRSPVAWIAERKETELL